MQLRQKALNIISGPMTVEILEKARKHLGDAILEYGKMMLEEEIGGIGLFKNIIWDFDGILFDTYPGMTYAFKRALAESGVEASQEEILKYMKISVSYAINHFKEKHALSDEFIEKYSFYEHNLEVDKVMPFPYVKEICFEFKKSGGRNFILTHRGSSTHEFLKYHGMIDYFVEIGTKHNGFKRKPDPEGFTYFVNKYNMSKDTVLAIGDRACDILGAKNAGIKTCLYNTNGIESDEKSDFTINSLSELFNILF